MARKQISSLPVKPAKISEKDIGKWIKVGYLDSKSSIGILLPFDVAAGRPNDDVSHYNLKIFNPRTGKIEAFDDVDQVITVGNKAR